jgi:hypothetical protein
MAINIFFCRILVSGYELDEKDDLIASFQVNKSYKSTQESVDQCSGSIKFWCKSGSADPCL